MNDITTGELSAKSSSKDVTWKIPNFLSLYEEGDCFVYSPEFAFLNATWCLQMFLDGEEYSDSTCWIDLVTVRRSSSVPGHRIEYDIGLETRFGEKHEPYTSESTFSDVVCQKGILCHFESSEIRARSDLLLPDGTLTVFCRVQMTTGETRMVQSFPTELPESSSHSIEHLELTPQTDSSTPKEVPGVPSSVQKLQLDYKKLLESGEESDVCLKVSGKEFRAHRCILRARSEVFNSMFKYETKEKTSGEVVIDDIEPDSFPDFLQHVYSGRVETLSHENVFHLYSAADKYDVQELKSECLEHMKHTLSVDTFCDVITLALRYQEEELLRLAVDFFSKNITEIIVTVKWQNFLRDHYMEANELLIKALKKK